MFMLGCMKQITAYTFAACMALSPAFADSNSAKEGVNLIEEGARLLLREFIDELEPKLEDFLGKAEEMRPTLEALQEMIGDISNYHLPEVLPNGDIIIRRRTPLEVELSEDGEVEL